MRSRSALLTLSLILHITEAKQSQLMETLQCTNDFKSFVSCTWSEHPDAHKLVKMNLFYKQKDSRDFRPMPCGPSQMDSQSWKWNCNRSKDFFDVFVGENYTFKPDRKLEARLNVSLFDHVQPPPPKGLGINHTEDGDFLLTWKAYGGTNGSCGLNEALEYQLTYKRTWEPWEGSASVFISNISHYLLHHHDLVPGSAYVARVRSKPHQDSGCSGRYSEWSSNVTWTTQAGDEAQPQNLHCLFNSIDRLSCTWELKRELTSSVIFALFYKISPEAKEMRCSPVEEKQLADTAHVLQSCEISVINPKKLNQYVITVRPEEEEKMIEPVVNIKLDPPYELSVTKRTDPWYTLHWKVHGSQSCINRESDKPLRAYQVLYWEADKPPEQSKAQNIADSLLFSFPSLEPGTRYKAKVRAKHSGAYACDGPWSEWSEEYEWVTDRELPFWSFVVALLTVIILMMLGLYYGQRYLLGKRREWKRNIPSPPRKILCQDYFVKVQLPESFEESSSQSFLEEGGEFGSSNASDRQRLVRYSNSLGAGLGEIRPPSAVFQNTEIPAFSESKVDQSLSQAESSSTPACSLNAKVGLSQGVFDFNGPYLMSPQESPVSDVHGKVALLEMRETPVSMQYVELPHGSGPSVLPVGKENGKPPPLCTAHSEEVEKLPLSKRQEVPEGQLGRGILEKEENHGQRTQGPTTSNNHSQNGILDYFTTENLPRSTERSSSLPIPVVALKKMFNCDTMATSTSQLPQPTEGLSSSEISQKKPDTVCPPEEQAPAVPLETSQDLFGDYVMTPPRTSGSMTKEGHALSTEDPGHNKSIVVFIPDDKSPIFLHQVDDYCFFPNTKPDTKPPKESTGHQFAKDSQSLTKHPRESKFVESELLTTSHILQV